MLAILPATINETKAVLSVLTVRNTEITPFCTVYTCLYENKKLLVCTLGVGKVAAAISTQYLLDHYPVNILLNCGTCGGVYGEVELGKVYLVDKCCQYDYDISAVDNVPVGNIANREGVFFELFCPTPLKNLYSVASLATGDKFDTSAELPKYVKKHFDCPLRDMEGGAVAQVAEANGVPLMMLKGVSDFVGENCANMYKVYAEAALRDIAKHISAIAQCDEED